MRKPILLLAACAALVASATAAAPALAATDPSCDGDPYANDFALHDMSLGVSGTPVAHWVAGIDGSGLACGTDIGTGSSHPGWETLNDNADIVNPPGVEVNPTQSAANPGGIPVGSFTGNTKLNAASWALSVPLIAPNQQADIFVDEMANCEAENQITAGGPVPGTIVACYKGLTTGVIPGHAWIWTTRSATTQTLTIGPFYNDLTNDPAGLTHIKEFAMCSRAGDPGSTSCGGGGDPWVQKNGDASAGNCRRGGANPNGVYTVTVTNKAGQTSAGVPVCVSWMGTHKVSG